MNSQFQSVSEQDILLVETDFAEVLLRQEVLSSKLYQQLLDRAANFSPLFDTDSAEQQQKKILAGMVLMIQSLRETDLLESYLHSLAEQFSKKGISADFYVAFSDSWLSVLAEMAGDKWTPQLGQAWRKVMDYVLSVIYQALTEMNSVKANDAATPPLQVPISNVETPTTAQPCASGIGTKSDETLTALRQTLFQIDLLALNIAVEARALSATENHLLMMATQLLELSQHSTLYLDRLKDRPPLTGR